LPTTTSTPTVTPVPTVTPTPTVTPKMNVIDGWVYACINSQVTFWKSLLKGWFPQLAN
jgi:hypothetical protein